MPGDGKPSGRPRDAQLDERIIAAARQILSEDGYDAVTMSAVARRAGLPRSTVYRRYPTLAGLRFGALFVPEGRFAPPVSTGDTRSDMAAHIAANAAGFQEAHTRTLLRALTADALTDEQARRDLGERFLLPRLQQVADVIDAGRYPGDLAAPVRGEVAAKVITGALIYQSLVLDQPVDQVFLGALLDLLFPPAAGHAGSVTTMNKPLGPYSPAVRAGDFLVVSGQTGSRDGALVEGGLEAECRQVFANLRGVLEGNGSSLDAVVKTTVFLVDMGDFAAMNAVYAEEFGDNRPARSTIAVAALPLGARVEIEAWAFVGSGQ